MPKGVKGFQKKAVAVSEKVQHASEVPASSEILEVAQVLAALASQPDAVATTPARQASAKRRCGDLDSLTERTWASERYAAETHTNYLLESRNVEMTSEKVTLRSKKARAAAVARWSGFVEDEEGTVFEKDETAGALGPGMAAARRTTIAFFFESYYGSPPESEWGGRGGVIARIMHRVGVPEGSKALVCKVLEDVVAAQEEGDATCRSWGSAVSHRWVVIHALTIIFHNKNTPRPEIHPLVAQNPMQNNLFPAVSKHDMCFLNAPSKSR